MCVCGPRLQHCGYVRVGHKFATKTHTHTCSAESPRIYVPTTTNSEDTRCVSAASHAQLDCHTFHSESTVTAHTNTHTHTHTHKRHNTGKTHTHCDTHTNASQDSQLVAQLSSSVLHTHTLNKYRTQPPAFVCSLYPSFFKTKTNHSK
jgi:hypothetical protein